MKGMEDVAMQNSKRKKYHSLPYLHCRSPNEKQLFSDQREADKDE